MARMRKAKKTLQASKVYDPELKAVYGKLLAEVYFESARHLYATCKRPA